MLMVDKAGKNAFTPFNPAVSPKLQHGGFRARRNMLLLDLLSAKASPPAGEQIDVTPFVELTGSVITAARPLRSSHAKAVYPLYQLVDAQSLPVVQAQLKLDPRCGWSILPAQGQRAERRRHPESGYR